MNKALFEVWGGLELDFLCRSCAFVYGHYNARAGLDRYGTTNLYNTTIIDALIRFE